MHEIALNPSVGPPGASLGGFTTVRMAFTAACNMDCFYCHNEGQDADVRDPARRVDPALFARACRVLRASGHSTANITGGEFAFHPQWRALIAQVREVFDDLVVTTNASLLSEDDVRYLARLGPSRYNVSLDTADPVKFRMVTRSSSYATVISTIARIWEATGAEIVVNAVMLRNVNDSVEALRKIARAVGQYSRQVNVIRPHNNLHRQGFSPAGSDEYDRLVEAVKGASPGYSEKSYPDGSTNVKALLDGVQFNFKAIHPRPHVPFCDGCAYKIVCTEWIIPPRFHVETGELSACLLNPAKRLLLYDTARDTAALERDARDLCRSAWASVHEVGIG